MTKLDIQAIYLQIGLEIKKLYVDSNLQRKNALQLDAQQAIDSLKPKINTWVDQLCGRTMACHELESKLEEQRSFIKMTNIQTFSITEDELQDYKNDILKIIAKSIMNEYLESLFRNRKVSTSINGGYSRK